MYRLVLLNQTKGYGMKKLVLTSLMAVFAVSGAQAANVINNNPLYRPEAGQFYSVTTLASHSEKTELWGLGEEFGYGITDRLSAIVKTNVAEADWFDAMEWGETSFGLNLRALDMGAWKGDVYGAYALSPVWGDHRPFLDEDDTYYTWTAGVRAGYVTRAWTVAGHVEFNYGNTESFNWGDDGVHTLSVGVDGQYALNSAWNLTAGVEYTGVLDDEVFGMDVEDAGRWTGEFGVNYNIDDNKYIGAYVNGEVAHYTGDWEFEDGFGFGFKFGAQF